MTIGETIRQTRQAEGLTRRSLALLAGLSDKCIERIEYNERQPRLSTLTKIADGLDRVMIITYNPNKKVIDIEFKLRQTVRLKSFETVVCSEETQKSLMKVAIKLCNYDTFRAKDLVQETIYQALLCEDRFNSKSQVFTWLYSIMRNIRKAELKKLKDITFVESYFETGEETEELREEIKVRKYVNRLNKAAKEIIKLRLLNLQYNDISQQVNKTAQECREIHSKTLKRIRKRVQLN